MKLTVAPGVFLWREKLSAAAQKLLLAEVQEKLKTAPLYRPAMPGTGKPFSAQESNFGPLGWVADKTGYRYQPTHPVTGAAWPAMPPALLALWDEIAPMFGFSGAPDCCLVNFYDAGARMGLHQDRDEGNASAPVIGVSLGDSALFRIGGITRGGKTASLELASGDVIAFGGPARLAFPGIDRMRPDTSRLLSGRLSLTLR
ncbi:MAG TPA: alpha-ketoglutarate-dependent dioxygenase AlkB, partial [Rhizomicrobium sp.]|nr:alpha-ketoglutarate-dependent dioxygenase AlkB [Rhizomicrobium sp.]